MEAAFVSVFYLYGTFAIACHAW